MLLREPQGLPQGVVAMDDSVPDALHQVFLSSYIAYSLFAADLPIKGSFFCYPELLSLAVFKLLRQALEYAVSFWVMPSQGLQEWEI